jgi:hypothetical protein
MPHIDFVDYSQMLLFKVFKVALDSKVVLHAANDLEKSHGVDDLLGIPNPGSKSQ